MYKSNMIKQAIGLVISELIIENMLIVNYIVVTNFYRVHTLRTLLQITNIVELYSTYNCVEMCFK